MAGWVVPKGRTPRTDMAGSLNQHVVTWARGKLGQKVGAGECWDLADGALRAAGAASSTTTGDDDDYVWGDSLIPAGALPGDIVQFRDYEATIRHHDRQSRSRTAAVPSTRPKTSSNGRITPAVIESVGPKGFVVLEQNVDPGGQKVQRHTLPFVSQHDGQHRPKTDADVERQLSARQGRRHRGGHRDWPALGLSAQARHQVTD